MFKYLGIFKTVETCDGVFQYRWSLSWLLCRSTVIQIKKIDRRLRLPAGLIKWCGRRALQRRVDGGRWQTLLSDDTGRIVEVR